MARIIQILLPLMCLVLAETQLHMPFFDHMPGLPHPPRPTTDGRNTGYDTWFQHFGNPDEHSSNSDIHERDKSYEDYDLFYHGDPYFQGNGWNQMPGINPDYNNQRHQPSHNGNNPQESPKQDHKDISNVQKSEEKPKEIPPIDKKPTEPKLNEDNIPGVKDKLKEAIIVGVKNNSDLLPPKTNKIKNEDEKADTDNKKVGLNKKKDFLVVGQGNNGNKVYVLHENNPNPNTVIIPNGNQPGNNIICVPYNPGQTNNPVNQVTNGQPGSLPANFQMTEDKMGVSNGYDNAGQSPTNLNTGKQNPGYVTIYSNGQLIQIPGVVVNSAPNNIPVQNGNPIQGTNYINANTVPNNVQTVPVKQNPGTNVIYATIPNQASNGPIYVQVPNPVNAVSNGCGSGTVQGVYNNGMSNNGLPSNVVFYQGIPNTVAQPAVLPNGVSNGYVQPNMVANQGQEGITITIPNQGTVLSNQNSPYQPAVELPINSGTNRYNQPIVSNLGQGQNAPNQGCMMGNQNVPIQTAVLMPVGSNNNGYNQPSVTSQQQQMNAPTQRVMYNQYTPPQQVQMPVNNGINGYNQPMVSNQAPEPNAPNHGGIVSNQNTPLQPAVEIPIPNGCNVNPPVTNSSPAVTVQNQGDIPSNQNEQPEPSVALDSGSNEYQQPQVSNQGDQGTNAIVNTPNNGEVINQESDSAQPLATSSLILDSNNLLSLGAQPAVMISDFKDTPGDKKDEKSKDKKKGKGKKKHKKHKDDDKPKDLQPFTNRMKDAKR